MKTSKNWVLIKEDWLKIGKGLLIALAGGVVAFLGQVTGVIDYTLYGQWGPLVALAVGSFASALVNLLNKWISSTQY